MGIKFENDESGTWQGTTRMVLERMARDVTEEGYQQIEVTVTVVDSYTPAGNRALYTLTGNLVRWVDQTEPAEYAVAGTEALQMVMGWGIALVDVDKIVSLEVA